MKSWFPHILIMLMALQSVMAVADIHPEHQDEHHQQVQDDHSKTASSSQTQQELTSGVDCQHCCHCQSPQSLFETIIIKSQSPHHSDSHQRAPITLASQLFKPPRG